MYGCQIVNLEFLIPVLPGTNQPRYRIGVTKLSKHALKDPDQIWKASRSIFTWLRASTGLVITVLVVTFVATVGILFYLQLAEKNEGKAQFHLAKAKASYEAFALTKGEATPKALEDLTKELEELTRNYPSSRAQGLAHGLRAQMALKMGKQEEALKHLKFFEAALPSKQKDLARIPLAVAFEDAEQWESALEIYGKLSSSKEPYFSRLGLMGEGRVLRRLEKIADATQRYQTFMEKFGAAPEAVVVKGLLAELKGGAAPAAESPTSAPSKSTSSSSGSTRPSSGSTSSDTTSSKTSSSTTP